uniref:Uncharacterized protein n=1 Tax=Fagus sylvatica TaxID=28930 RepID=A0A2N9IRM1_FAGSY
MAPESRGVEAVFSRFSGEDSGQTREATVEPRVVRCSWSCHLSNAPRLVDQLAASRKESAREGGCPGGKMLLDLRETELGLERYGPANRGHQSVFGLSKGIFPIEIPARLGKILTIREFHIVSEHVLFLTHSGLRINSLGRSAQSRFWSGQRLGQTSVKLGPSWSNLPELWEMCSGPRFEALLMWWAPAGSEWLRSNLGQSWSTLVKLGQSWSNLLETREVCSGPRLEVFLMCRVSVGFDWFGLGCLVLRADTQENPEETAITVDNWVKDLLKQHNDSNNNTSNLQMILTLLWFLLASPNNASNTGLVRNTTHATSWTPDNNWREDSSERDLRRGCYIKRVWGFRASCQASFGQPILFGHNRSPDLHLKARLSEFDADAKYHGFL